MITTFSTLEPTMVDRIRYRFSKEGQDFDYWLNKHLTESEHYVFKGDNFFMMGYREGDAWVVFFAHTERGYKLGDLFRMMPYELPYIAFVRGLRGKKDLKYYPWEHLSKLCDTLGSFING